ncbi:unnamed protein product [Prorocentrum cordatum]|uniref:Uncharacterized protein n=1 Tax=Prorocentrum cordatum TaxID=2364126 RepID=A0ABN9PGA4_9DINO|nr:unnamed protein product [Polarella glacialis]
MASWSGKYGQGSRGSHYSASPTTAEWKRDPSGARHYAGHRALPSTTPRARARKGCQSSNHTKNARSTCSMRRSWAEAAKSATQPSSPPPAPKPPANNVPQKFQAVAAKLSQAAGASAAPSCERLPQTPPPASASPGGTGAASEPSPAKRSQLVDAAKTLEAALAAAPEGPGLEEARQQLQAQLDAIRKELGDTRPLGKRLDGAKAALERAKTRQAAAEESPQLAQQAARAATTEVATLQQTSHKLEMQIPGHTDPPRTSLEELGAQPRAAVEQLAALGSISPAAVEEAKTQSDAVSARFQPTLEHAENVDAPMRMNGTQAPARARARLNGERRPKRVITTFETRAQKRRQLAPCDFSRNTAETQH